MKGDKGLAGVYKMVTTGELFQHHYEVLASIKSNRHTA